MANISIHTCITLHNYTWYLVSILYKGTLGNIYMSIFASFAHLSGHIRLRGCATPGILARFAY